MSRAQALVVGSNDVFLDSLADWIAGDGLFEVVGRAHSGTEALAWIGTQPADLVLIDVILPDMSGFEVARRIKARSEAPLVVLLSFHDSHAARLEAWAAGADGFVPKSETTSCLTPLVGNLLRQRDRGLQEQGSVSSTTWVPPVDPSE